MPIRGSSAAPSWGPPMWISDLVTRLDGAKRTGDGWMARCPAHEDDRPSLSLRDGTDGRILVHCHAGCPPEAIVGALGLTLPDLFADPVPSGRDILETYDYTDADGTLLYQVVRFAPKDFRQRRPDGQGGWVWNLNGTPRVLYRLPELRTAIAAGKRVFVVEGERDVETVRRAGYAATTNAGGAGKWRAEYSEGLRSADVVVVADRDAPGRTHAQDVARALQGVAARVVVVEAAEGKDVTDHLAAGKTLRELVPVVEQAIPEHVKNDVGGLTHIRDLLAEPDDVVSWIVDGLLPAGGLSVFVSKPKAGKSTTARAIVLRVSRGEPVLGRATTQGPVIYLGLEDHRRVTKGHLRMLGAQPDDDLYVFTGHHPDEALVWLEAMLGKVDPVLVVVDTLQHLLGVSDLNDYARVVAALAPVLGLVRSRRAHLMLLHHAGKSDRPGFDAILGSQGIRGTVDTSLLLRRREDGTRTLATEQRTGEDLPESVVTLDAYREPHIDGTRAEYDAKQAEERVLAWLEKQAEPATRGDLLSGVEGDANVNTRALYTLVKAGRVGRTGKGMKGDAFLYACLHACIHPIDHASIQASENGQECPNDAPIACIPETPLSTPDTEPRMQASGHPLSRIHTFGSQATCARCGQPCEAGPWPELLCVVCAVGAGNADAEALRLERAAMEAEGAA